MRVLSLWHGWLEVGDRKRSMRDIAIEVAEKYGLDLATLKTPTRKRYIAWPRQEAMAKMYWTGRYSNLQIAHFFGMIDHTNVVHARHVYEARAGL